MKIEKSRPDDLTGAGGFENQLLRVGWSEETKKKGVIGMFRFEAVKLVCAGGVPKKKKKKKEKNPAIGEDVV